MPDPLKNFFRKLKNIFHKKTLIPDMLYNWVKDNKGKLIKDTRVSNTAYFYHKDRIKLGENVFIWHHTILDGTGGIEIEEGTQVGAWVGIFTHSSHIAIRLYGRHYGEIPEQEKKAYMIKPVKIGKYCFVGPGSIIMPGVTIGKGCIIAAGSLVTSDIPDFAIVNGNPAQVEGDTRKLDSRYLKKDENLRKYYSEWSGCELGELMKNL